MEFSADEDGILISIPFAENTPQCIKDRLNDIIFHEMNKYLESLECMSMPCCLRLNARMQIQYSNNESDTHYYLSMVITDIPEIESGTWIDKDIDISLQLCNFTDFLQLCHNLFTFCRVIFQILLCILPSLPNLISIIEIP